MTSPSGVLDIPELAARSHPALLWPQPDIDWHVYQIIKPLGGTITWSFGSNEGDPAGWIFTSHIQVDVRASRKVTAWARADMARRAICALPWTPWEQGCVGRVSVEDGPSWLPDATNAPRYVARYAITYHPARSRPAD